MNTRENQRAEQINPRPEWPAILDRYVQEVGADPEYQPRRMARMYHGLSVTVWHGRVHIGRTWKAGSRTPG